MVATRPECLDVLWMWGSSWSWGFFHLTTFHPNHISTLVLLLKFLENVGIIKLCILHNYLENLLRYQLKSTIVPDKVQQRCGIWQYWHEECPLTRLWLNRNSVTKKTEARIMKEVLLKAQDIAVGDQNVEFRSNLYMAESTSGQGQCLTHRYYHGGGFGIMKLFCEVGGWPLTSTWGTKDSVTHTKKDIQELWNPTITLILYDGGIQNPQCILYYWFSKNKQKLVFMKQNNLPVPKSSFLREPRPQYLGWKQQKYTTLRASWKLRDVWWDPLLFLCSLSLLLFCFMEG